ncbi:hypothetical protein FALBO_5135 [Fusarium albosuccineum]|uniref:NAD(P)-binding domain-containing protein n=1 Tax=Fusarium albosuccineum TaxID=1237068 RepID=A0A8H4LIA5_9HYPO|nr:hypothetical protein FALBO_5135 [Fusarium albosuccineum]
MSSAKPTIACFGATGGCVAAALASALKEGHHCTALARTPGKLRNLLTTGHSIPSATVDQYLAIYQGDMKDPAAARRNKKNMEKVVMEDGGKHVRDFVIMRPLFLTDGAARGDDHLRVGWEWGIDRGEDEVKEPGPVIGYYISRKDVGEWTFNHVIAQGGREGNSGIGDLDGPLLHSDAQLSSHLEFC